MQRTGDLAGTTTSTMSAVAPTLPRPATRSAKRQLEQQDAVSNPLPSKRARRSVDAGVDASERLLPGCRGGGVRRRPRRVIEDSEDDEQSPATPEKGPAAQANESHDESKDTTASSQKPAEDTTGSNDNGDENSSGSMSSPRKSVDETDGSTKDTPESKKSAEEVTSSDPETATKEPETAGNEESSSPNENSTDLAPPAPTTAVSEEGSSTEVSAGASSKSTRLTDIELHNISGLVNNNQQCFANSVIQLVDAALDDYDVDMVLGKNGSTAPFSEPHLTPDDQESLPEPTSRSKGKKDQKKRESKVTRIKTGIHDRIRKLRTEGKLKALSLRGHLRALINRMRQHKGKGSSKLVTPIVFQQILAHGDEEAELEHLDGHQQQDCYEYFQALVNGLKNDTSRDASVEESVEKSEIINSMFEAKTETRTVCSNESCDFKGDPTAHTQNAHTVHLASSSGKGKKTAMDLLEESNVSEMDSECGKCGERKLQRVTEFTKVADNFVLHILRGRHGTTRKIKTPVELPLQPIDLCGKQFVLNAVIKHKGDTTSHGHYTICRRRTRHWTETTKSLWCQINDFDIYPLDAKDVQDSGRHGQSTMLLFKAL
jgi:ubiquitin C-terminal hydrolase